MIINRQSPGVSDFTVLDLLSIWRSKHMRIVLRVIIISYLSLVRPTGLYFAGSRHYSDAIHRRSLPSDRKLFSMQWISIFPYRFALLRAVSSACWDKNPTLVSLRHSKLGRPYRWDFKAFRHQHLEVTEVNVVRKPIRWPVLVDVREMNQEFEHRCYPTHPLIEGKIVWYPAKHFSIKVINPWRFEMIHRGTKSNGHLGRFAYGLSLETISKSMQAKTLPIASRAGRWEYPTAFRGVFRCHKPRTAARKVEWLRTPSWH